MDDALAAYLDGASPRFRETHAALGRLVRRHFRNAKPVFLYGMPGWVSKRPRGAVVPEKAGTMDPTLVFIGFVERKNGLTLHLWHPHPKGYGLIGQRKAELAKAGLKAMVGCLVHSRKGDFPLDAVDDLLARAAAVDRA